MKKHQRLLSAVVQILFPVILTLLSGHPFETGLLFGGACLLQRQAGGLETAGLLPKILSFLTLWILGNISYPVVCPLWVLYLLIFMANATIYLFAPATSQEEPEEYLIARFCIRQNQPACRPRLPPGSACPG